MQKKDYVLLLTTFLVLFLLGVVIVQSDFIKKTDQINNSIPSIGEVISDEVKEAVGDSEDNKNEGALLIASEDKVVDLENCYNVKTCEIAVNGGKVAKIDRKYESEFVIIKQTGDDVYIGASWTGRGGYILFGSQYGLYKFNIQNNEIIKIVDDEIVTEKTFQIYDISPDQKYMAGTGFIDDYKDKIIIKDLKDSSLVKSFACPDSKYGQLGNVYFFDGGKKLVYEAAIGNPDDEEFAMFTIDIQSGQQKIVANEAGGKIDAADWAIRRQ